MNPVSSRDARVMTPPLEVRSSAFRRLRLRLAPDRVNAELQTQNDSPDRPHPSTPAGNAHASPRRASARARAQAAFTQPELLVASAIAIFVMSGFFIFSDFTGRSLAGIARQNLLNQKAGYAADYLVSRIRLATFVTNDASGNTLILAFDDSPTVDSNGDGIFGNDRDHWELFQFQNVDGSDTTAADNRLIYKPNTNATASTTLINGCLRKLPNLPVFSITNQATVRINYGMLDSLTAERSQTIEIRTQAVRRNRPD